MGNRATIEVKDHEMSAPCYAYLHWMGSPDQVVSMVRKAAPVMRRIDCNYAMARLIGTYHVEIDGGLSLGVTTYKEDWDNGHYVVNLAKGTVENARGKILARNIEFGQF